MAINYTAEQKQAIMHDKGNVLVSASAGSGKTFVMIERLINLIISGKTNVENILAVTFTQLAAAEMKTKLSDALTKKINDAETDEQTVARLKEQLSQVPMAEISTFHSFCADLIRNYFYEAGVDALFKIADETESKLLKNAALDELFNNLYEANDEGFKHVVKLFIKSRDDSSVKQLVLELYTFFQTEAYPEENQQRALFMYGNEGYKIIKDACFSQYREIFKRLHSSLKKSEEDLQSIGAKKSVQACKNLIEYSNQILNTKDLLEMAKTCAGIKITLPRLSPKDEYEQAIKDAFSETKKSLTKLAGELHKNYGNTTDEILSQEISSMQAAAKELINLTNAFSEKYAALKKEENRLDFSDLEHIALKLLENETIRKTVSEKYDYVFADEYQDTNGVQEEILSRVANDNVFMVGDVKQSIYAFRGCDPTIFENKFSAYLSGKLNGKALTLDSNFRSSKKVLSAVNGIFSSIMVDSSGKPYRERPMTGGNGIDGLAALYIAEKQEKPSKTRKNKGVYSVKENLAGNSDEEISTEAALLIKLIKENLHTTLTQKDGESRSATYGDMVILTRSLGEYGKRLADALSSAGIPVSFDGGNEINAYPEIKHLISVLRIVDCADQDIHLAAALRGPFGGFTDCELAKIRAYSDKYYLRAGRRDESTFCDAVNKYREEQSDELKEKLDQFFCYLDELRFAADYLGAGGTLTKIIHDKRIDLYYTAEIDGKTRVNRINRLVDECTSNGQISVRDFLKRFDADPDALVLGGAGDSSAVKLMTVHASKGLEFPIVFVCGLSRTFNTDDLKKEIYTDKSYGFALKTYDENSMTVKSNLFRDLLKQRFYENRAKEEMRILYVALTRAREKLYLVQTSNVPKLSVTEETALNAKKFSDMFPSAAIPFYVCDTESLPFMEEKREENFLAAYAPDSDLTEIIKKNVSFEYPYDTTIPMKNSVTAILSAARAFETTEEATPVVKELFPSETSIEKGIAYHKAMELLSPEKATPEEITQQLNEFTEKGLMTVAQTAIIDTAKLAELLKDEIFHVPNGKYLREQPFEVLIPANLISNTESKDCVLIQGVIDLMVFCPDGIRIADYKVSSHTAERLKTDYGKQLDLYAYAAEKITGKKVISKTLFNLQLGEKTSL